MSNGAEIGIYLAVLGVGWVAYVVSRVRRDRKKLGGRGTADAYEGNLVVPAAASRRHGVFSGRRGIEYHGGTSGHAGAHHGPGGFDRHGHSGGVDGGHR